MLSVVEEICLGLYTVIVYLILSAKAKPPPSPPSKTMKTGTTVAMWQNAEHQPLKPPQSTTAKSWSISCKHLYTNWTSCTVINFPDSMWDSLQHTKPNTDSCIFRIRTYLTEVSHDLICLYLVCSLLNVREFVFYWSLCFSPEQHVCCSNINAEVKNSAVVDVYLKIQKVF